MNTFLIVALVSAVAVSVTNGAPSVCPNFCNFDYNPVCAEYNGCSKTFGNRCALGVAVCNGEGFVLKYEGECKNENLCAEVQSRGIECTPCTREWNPVCAENSVGEKKSFNNECEVGFRNCQEGTDFIKKTDGACGNTIQARNNCNAICTADENPICAEDSRGSRKTFSNECIMKVLNCQKGNDFVKTANGKCSETIQAKAAPCEACNRDYNPVCAENSSGERKTFPNECEMRSQNCQKGTDFVKNVEGECQESIHSRAALCDVCTKEYNPVCAENSNGQKQTFSNECVMRSQNCEKGTDFVKKTNGKCSGSQLLKKITSTCKPCSRELIPVCAKNSNGNQKSFGNKCLIDFENCESGDDFELINEGLCTEDNQIQLQNQGNQKECPLICPYLYKPVCASNGSFSKAFDNECLLRYNNCQKSNDQFVITNGAECGFKVSTK